jgi:hypothetical protein
MNTLWILFLRAVHVWSGRRLRQATVKRMLRALNRKLRDQATNPHRN